MVKKLKRDVGKLAEVGIVLGTGAAIAGATGHGGAAFATAGRLFGPVAGGVVGIHAIRLAKNNLKPSKFNTKAYKKKSFGGK